MLEYCQKFGKVTAAFSLPIHMQYLRKHKSIMLVQLIIRILNDIFRMQLNRMECYRQNDMQLYYKKMTIHIKWHRFHRKNTLKKKNQ
jgi:hypothetical protein